MLDTISILFFKRMLNCWNEITTNKTRYHNAEQFLRFIENLSRIYYKAKCQIITNRKLKKEKKRKRRARACTSTSMAEQHWFYWIFHFGLHAHVLYVIWANQSTLDWPLKDFVCVHFIYLFIFVDNKRAEIHLFQINHHTPAN